MKLFILKGEDYDRGEVVLFVADSMEQSVKLMNKFYDKWKHIFTKRANIEHATELRQAAWNSEQSLHLQWCEDTIDALWAETDAQAKMDHCYPTHVSQITMLKRHQRNVSNVYMPCNLENQQFMHSTWHCEAIDQAIGLSGNKAECIERWKEQLIAFESNTFLEIYSWI